MLKGKSGPHEGSRGGGSGSASFSETCSLLGLTLKQHRVRTHKGARRPRVRPAVDVDFINIVCSRHAALMRTVNLITVK